jgi:hypothetical protein
MGRLRFFFVLLVALPVVLATAAGAMAAGGNYVFQGGTPSEQQQVRQALQASSFNWSIVPEQVTITIADTPTSEALPGQIWLDAKLLDSGKFSWGVVQHEYAHQVDFELFDDAARARLFAALGGSDWCDVGNGAAHNQHGCERFASTLAWAYWQSPDNCMKPSQVAGESGAMTPASFRSLMSTVLGQAVVSAAVAPGIAVPAKAPAVRQSAGAARVWVKRAGKWRAVKIASLT